LKQPIGVFDSGLGGLTVVRHLRRLLPAEDIVYFGDTARVPYGSKSPAAVTRFSMENCRFLLSHNVKMIVVACNTSSALALGTIRRECRLPVFDVIAPGARNAALATVTGRVGVIGTYATIRSGAYEREIRMWKEGVRIYARPCPLFVPLAEEGWLDRQATVKITREYLLPMKGEGIDVLILGCTHYPVLIETIRLVMGERVALIDSGLSCAESVRAALGAAGISTGGVVKYFVSDMPERFREIGRVFMGEEIRDVAVVPQVVA
jgi:glutamate racemase